MFKFVLSDYRRQAWSALKSAFVFENWYFFFYMSIIPPIMFSLNWYQAYIYYSIFGPMLFGILLARMYPNRISKTLLLCPMTLADRKNYLIIGFKIRIVSSLLLFLICNIPLFCMGKVMILHFSVTFVFLLLVLVSVNIYCNPIVNAQSAFAKEYDLPGYYPIWEVAVKLVGIFGMLALANIQMKRLDYFEDEVVLVLAALLFLTELGLCIKMIKTYYKPVMEQAMYYTSGYRREE